MSTVTTSAPDLVTTKEAAVLLGVSHDSISLYRKAGALVAVHGGGRRGVLTLYQRADVEALARQRLEARGPLAEAAPGVPLLTLAETAARLGCSVSRVCKIRDAGRLRPVDFRGPKAGARYAEPDVEALRVQRERWRDRRGAAPPAPVSTPQRTRSLPSGPLRARPPAAGPQLAAVAPPEPAPTPEVAAPATPRRRGRPRKAPASASPAAPWRLLRITLATPPPGHPDVEEIGRGHHPETCEGLALVDCGGAPLAWDADRLALDPRPAGRVAYLVDYCPPPARLPMTVWPWKRQVLARA